MLLIISLLTLAEGFRPLPIVTGIQSVHVHGRPASRTLPRRVVYAEPPNNERKQKTFFDELNESGPQLLNPFSTEVYVNVAFTLAILFGVSKIGGLAAERFTPELSQEQVWGSSLPVTASPTISAEQPPLDAPASPVVSAEQPMLDAPASPTISAEQPPLDAPASPGISAEQPPPALQATVFPAPY